MFKAWGISLVLALLGLSTTDASKPEWALNATTIEACSCPMFCQCYFNTKPAAHHDHGAAAATHYCQFNNAYKVNHGHYGSVNLDGAKFWISGDLGSGFSQGKRTGRWVHSARPQPRNSRTPSVQSSRTSSP